ncbi:MAG: CDP-diacylglycerol--serine O-phosphatidyltransferase, partial [Bacteroidia bacterium]
MKAIFNHRTKGSAIYLIPSLLTLGAMCCGFFAIIVSYQGKFIECTYLIFFAMVFDSLDGRVARLTHTSSPFGAELDSLSDMVNFGIAPAIIIYNWNLHNLDRIGGIVVFAYAACVALRLARFNTMISIVDKRFFLGLPCTAAAPVIVGYVWMCVVYHLNSSFFIIFGLILTLFIGFSMVSLVKFYSFKEIHFSRKTRFRALLIFLVILALLIIWPEFVVFGFFVFYVIIS